MTKPLTADDIQARIAKLRDEPQYVYVKPFSTTYHGILESLMSADGRFALGIGPIDTLTRGFGPKELVFITGFAHSGKCVTDNTLFTMADGTHRRAIDLAAGNGVIGGNGPCRVVGVEYNGHHEIARVTTHGGHVLEVTTNHPVMTSTGWVNAGDLTEFDVLILESGWLGFSEPLPWDDAFFVGLFIGDGHWTPRSPDVRYSSADHEIVEWIDQYTRNLGVEMKHHAHYDYRFLGGRKGGEHALKRHLRRFGVEACRAPDKMVPAAIMRGGPDTWRAFLSGLLDSDGTVSSSAVVWESSSHALLVDCRALLARLGYESKLSRSKNGYAGHSRLTVAQFRGAQRLAAELHCVGPKSGRLQELAAKKTRNSGPTDAAGQVKSVEILPPQRTWAVEVDSEHTHLTDGIVTHNTQLVNTAILNNLDKRILFFSMDDPAEMILLKLTCMYAGIPADELERQIHRGDEEAKATLRHAATDIFKNLIVVDDSLGLGSMDKAIEEAKHLWGAPPDLVVIDYLELMQGDSVSDDANANVKKKSQSLKKWVKGKDWPTVVLHQGTRSGSEPGKPITLTSMAYGGEQEGTIVIGVRRKKDNRDADVWERQTHENTVTLHVVKNKRPPARITKADGLDLHMDKQTGLIRTIRPGELQGAPTTVEREDKPVKTIAELERVVEVAEREVSRVNPS